MRNAEAFNRAVDAAFDSMLAALSCDPDANEARLISHWQDDAPRGYRLLVTRKSDGVSATRFIPWTGN